MIDIQNSCPERIMYQEGKNAIKVNMDSPDGKEIIVEDDSNSSSSGERGSADIHVLMLDKLGSELKTMFS
jgi:hypothetical protein